MQKIQKSEAPVGKHLKHSSSHYIEVTPLKTTSIEDLPFPAGLPYKQTFENLMSSWIILGIHITVYLIATSFLQKKKDIRG
jgi:hypothetical protein